MSLDSIPTAITGLLGALTSLGVFKYFVEPRLIARQLRRKYATAVWMTCKELQLHLQQIADKLSQNNIKSINALKKIPDNDFKGRADWFTKDGYYTTVTAYKIAVVSSWLHIYQQELLFSTYGGSRNFVFELYQNVNNLKTALSANTCLWYEYIGAIGSQLVDHTVEITRPLSFGAFCNRYISDPQFRKFYEQLHMFIWHVASGNFADTIPKTCKALEDLIQFLKKQNLLVGLRIDRPAINLELPAVEPPH